MKLIISIFVLLFCGAAFADVNADIHAFADEMQKNYGLDRDKVIYSLYGANISEISLKKTAHPTEQVTWGQYKTYFLNSKKVYDGIAFYKANEEALKRAEQKYNVSSYVIAAVLGVETNYGTYKLKHRAIDALATLAFNSPDRAPFFRDELKWLFIFADKEKEDPSIYLSSYAGAIGYPQFMPSNIIKLAVDFDGDGEINLVNSIPDAIGSIGNYLSYHGYVKGGLMGVRAGVTGEAWSKYLNKTMKPYVTVKELEDAGVTPQTPLEPTAKVAFYRLHGADGAEYWIFANNFYAVSRYNPRTNYIMAVMSLADEIRAGITQHAFSDSIIRD